MNNDFTPRMKQILMIMLREDTILSVQKLADELGVSKRTVQRELEYLGSTLKKYNLEFKSRTGLGVWIGGAPDDREALYAQLVRNQERNYIDRNERRRQLILEILRSRTPHKLYYYSSLFGVSEATIGSDLDEIRPWFERFHLDITRKPGIGVSLEGSEKDYRQAVSAFLNDNLNNDTIRSAYETPRSACPAPAAQDTPDIIDRILDSDILKRVSACLLDLNDRRILNLTESSFYALILHVTIAINRIVMEELIDEAPVFPEPVEKDEDYELSAYIAEALEKEFEITIPEIEVAYICLHIRASKRQMLADSGQTVVTLGEEQKLLSRLAVRLIDAFDAELSYSLKQDTDFVRGLCVHLQPTLIRLKNDMQIQNPLLDQIKSNYPVIFQKCIHASSVLEEELGCSIPEAEIGFLCIHFGAAMVRLENQKVRMRRVDVGVVCASGIGISRLMSSKIRKNFMDRVEIHTYAKSDLTPFVLEQMDFFVSSIYGLQEDADILCVSPLLPESDMEKIAEKIMHYEHTEKRTRHAKEELQFGQIQYMAGQMKSIIKNMGYLRVVETITFDELLMAISEQLSPYNDRREMIQEDIRRRESLGTQIYADYRFALLHCRTHGVVRPVFSVCVTRDGTPFLDPYFQNIRAVITMLIPHDEYIRENSGIFSYLSEMLIEDASFLPSILGGDCERIRSELSRLLKNHFQQFINQV